MFNYVFIEAETKSPEKAPVVIWYNGGPGAASMFGLFVELGPYYLNEASVRAESYNKTGIPEVIYNPYAWTKVANVIAVNNPAPIGFSYCDPAGPSGDGYSCGDWNDELVAKANHRFLTNLFTTEFPEYADNDLFISGESYAGIYVPTIAREILRSPGPLNLKGFLVGDGCMGTEVLCGSGNPDKGPFYEVEFLHGHGQVSERLYREIQAKCPEAALRKGGEAMSAACNASINTMHKNKGGYFSYSLYDDCIYEEGFRRGLAEDTLEGALNDYPCPGDAMRIWLQKDAVRAALHIQPNNKFNSADNGIGMNYTLTEPNLLPFYKHVMLNTTLRVLVYNGDTDPGINSMVTQDKYFNYFSSEGIEPKREWRPWTLDGKQRMGGYVVEYHGSFAYLTIRGAGHMVPEYKPAASLAFLKAFLNNEAPKEYVPPKHARRSRIWN